MVNLKQFSCRCSYGNMYYMNIDWLASTTTNESSEQAQKGTTLVGGKQMKLI